MKLSAKQKEVVKLMREGNLLIRKTAFISQAYCGDLNITIPMLNRLIFVKLIHPKHQGPLATAYELTNLGKSIAL